jgi:hypothetical protein
LVEAQGVGEGHGFRSGGDVDTAQELVDGLKCLAVAGLVTNDAQRRGQEFKCRAGFFECLGLGADNDQQVAFAGTLRPA